MKTGAPKRHAVMFIRPTGVHSPPQKQWPMLMVSGSSSEYSPEFFSDERSSETLSAIVVNPVSEKCSAAKKSSIIILHGDYYMPVSKLLIRRTFITCIFISWTFHF
ncbi:hypothetical protein PUN28_018467 [Cardiocondyla obscurior]|uniref:Uncharacterized protein n=1 Tax=Cardiocondyla obscurior TaxID=286306 RepID=A0AAW2EHV9_9HYME